MPLSGSSERKNDKPKQAGYDGEMKVLLSCLECLSGAVRQLSQCRACFGASDYAGHRTKNILVQQLLMLHQGSLGRTTIPGRERRAKRLLSTADSTRGMARVKHSGFRRLVFFLRSTLAPRRVSKEMDDEKVSKLRPTVGL